MTWWEWWGRGWRSFSWSETHVVPCPPDEPSTHRCGRIQTSSERKYVTYVYARSRTWNPYARWPPNRRISSPITTSLFGTRISPGMPHTGWPRFTDLWVGHPIRQLGPGPEIRNLRHCQILGTRSWIFSPPNVRTLFTPQYHGAGN